MSSDKQEMSMTLLSLGENVGFVRGVVGMFVARMDPEMEEMADIKTAVSEAFTNCVVHAYPGEAGTVEIRCLVDPCGEFFVQITDYGIGIPDIETALTPLYTTGGAERSGMGFTIMEQFMSELTVVSRPNVGTTVTMVRKLKTKEANP